jgi:Recombination endonuclease VII
MMPPDSKNKALRVRRYELKRNYGLTPEMLASMVSAQSGLCAICREPGKRLVVDHNHATGKVRELLCPPCNHLLGAFKENIELMRKAALYIEHHRKPSE